MADLKDVIEAILTDLIDARHQANRYSQQISKDYAPDGELSHFDAPAVDIGNAHLEIKFIMEEPDETESVQPVSLGKKEVRKLAQPLVLQALSSPTVVLKEASASAANRKALAEKIAAIISEKTDMQAMKIDKAAIREATTLLRPHLGKGPNGRPVPVRGVSTVMRTLVANMEKELSREKERQVKVPLHRRPKMIVDINKLKQADAGVVATLSLDLDLDAMELDELDE